MDTKYHLRLRPHNFKLTTKNRSITECDLITMLSKTTFIDIMFVTLLSYVLLFLPGGWIVFYLPLFYHMFSKL